MLNNGEFYSIRPAGKTDHIALLLAGGEGMRLQELTRQIAGSPIPKQYCRLWHGSSLLQSTLSRAHLFVPRDRISIIVNQDHLRWAREQLSGVPPSNVLVQPMNRDTGPGILFALFRLAKKFPNAIVAVFPTDHFVDDDAAFVAHVLKATTAISQVPDKIAILGITPDRPETGYGYVLPSGPLDFCEGTYRVKAFVEKPDSGSARHIISRGALWNTFVMVFRISRMLELAREIVPRLYEQLAPLQDFPDRITGLYQDLSPWNFSTEVLTKIPEHLLLQEIADVRWSDWGTRESVERTYRALHMIPFWQIPAPGAHRVPG